MASASPEERALHERLVAGDPTASGEIIDQFLTPLIDELSRLGKYRALHRRDASFIWDAVTDALFNYVEAPQAYNPEKASLQYYLRMSAEGDLKNQLAKHTRKEAPKESLGSYVELGQEPWNREVGALPEEQHLVDADLWRRIEALIPDEQDRAVVRLLLDRERDTGVFAQVLDLGDLPVEEQRQEVKRVKDRLKAKLKRAGWKDYLER